MTRIDARYEIRERQGLMVKAQRFDTATAEEETEAGRQGKIVVRGRG